MIYLVVTETMVGDLLTVPGVDDVHGMTDGVVLVAAGIERSPLYHRIKELAPTEAPLLVAELQEIPKFKGMEPGALAWLRTLVVEFDASDPPPV